MSNDNNSDEFVERSQQKRHSFVRELFDFLRHNRKYWLIPIILVVVILGALVMLGGSAAAPFIYTLF